MLVCVWLFFIKQKTAYEMRISDWSTDVCSSDLIHHTVLGDVTELSGRLCVERGDVRVIHVVRVVGAQVEDAARRNVKRQGAGHRGDAEAAYPEPIKGAQYVQGGVKRIGCQGRAVLDVGNRAGDDDRSSEDRILPTLNTRRDTVDLDNVPVDRKSTRL